MGAIATAVKWYLDRNYSVDDIQSRTERRFGKSNLWRVNNEIGQQISARAYAIKATGFGDNTPLSRIAPPGPQGKTDNLRVSYSIKFDKPGREKGGRLMEVKFTLDSTRIGTIEGLRQQARIQAMEWVMKHYAVDGESAFSRLRAIEFESFSTF